MTVRIPASHWDTSDSAERRPALHETEEAMPWRKFVSGAARDVLGRPAHTTEIRGWVAQMASGVSRTTVATCLLNSAERRERWVNFIYQRMLKRAPTHDMLRFWCDLLGAGKSQDEVLAGILSSPEYVAVAGQKNDHYVRSLYRDVVGKPPSLDEIDSWVGLLDSASASRMAVAYQFVVSDDYRKRIVRDWYLNYLDREPDADAIEFSVEQLRLGHSHEVVQAQILSTREYFNRVLVKH